MSKKNNIVAPSGSGWLDEKSGRAMKFGKGYPYIFIAAREYREYLIKKYSTAL